MATPLNLVAARSVEVGSVADPLGPFAQRRGQRAEWTRHASKTLQRPRLSDDTRKPPTNTLLDRPNTIPGTRLILLLCASVAATPVTPIGAVNDVLPLKDLLDRSGRYVRQFEQDFTAVISDETYEQHVQRLTVQIPATTTRSTHVVGDAVYVAH